MIVMGKRPMITTTTIATTTTTIATTKIPQFSSTSRPSHIHVAQRPQDKIELSKLKILVKLMCCTIIIVNIEKDSKPQL